MPRTVNLAWTKVGTSDNSVIKGTNFQYLCTVLGILNLMQLFVATACVNIIFKYLGKTTLPWKNEMYGYDRDEYYFWQEEPYIKFAEKFFLSIAIISLVCTFYLLTACVVSISIVSMISKTAYGVIFHIVGCVLYSVAVIIHFVIIKHEKNIYDYTNEGFIITAAIGTVNAVLYLLSAILASRRSNVQLLKYIICENRFFKFQEIHN